LASYKHNSLPFSTPHSYALLSAESKTTGAAKRGRFITRVFAPITDDSFRWRYPSSLKKMGKIAFLWPALMIGSVAMLLGRELSPWALRLAAVRRMTKDATRHARSTVIFTIKLIL
jgi:hypothetical protein